MAIMQGRKNETIWALSPVLLLLLACDDACCWHGLVVDEREIMMRTSFDEPLFDASPWFLSGKNQRVLNDDQQFFPDMKYSQITMMRTSTQPFADKEVMNLRARIHAALTHPVSANFGPAVPASVENIDAGSNFDPRPQIIYVFSGFERGIDAPGAPVDYYQFYTLLDGVRFFVSIKRDGETGEILYASRRHSLSIPKDEEERRLQELQSKVGLQSRLDAPGWKMHSGEPLSWPGTSECLELSVRNQTFAHDISFPQINGQDVTRRLVQPCKPCLIRPSVQSIGDQHATPRNQAAGQDNFRWTRA